MPPQTLIFLCDNYPIAAREFFVDDEMRVIADKFEKVIVCTVALQYDIGLNRYVPENMVVEQFSRIVMEEGKWKSVFQMFSPMFIRELLFALWLLPIRRWFSAFKIMYVELHRAKRVKDYVCAIVQKYHLSIDNSVFYSYWHDYKAMALALLRKENPTIKCFARAHGWDVFAERQTPPYLPFKNFIIENLTKTISISDAGKKAFETYLNKDLTEKVVVSRLGKFNDRTPLLHKTNDDFVICSCSNLIPVKRVDKIIEVLSLLQIKNIKWIHFGDGPLREQLEKLTGEKLKNISIDFKGMVSNEKILDFYAEQFVDLFINLSDSEGIPVSIMEALSAGIPVLATNVGGTGECVSQENGFLVEKITPVEEIASVVDNYFVSNAESIISKRTIAYEFWKENYEAGRNYTDFEKILLSL